MNWKDIAVHDDKQIRGFFGNYRWLSNFHLCLIQFDGIVYPATENAYMAAKCKMQTQRVIFESVAPKVAKAEGMKVVLREDWEQVKLDIMYQLNLQKFSNDPHLRACLLATGDAYIEETNWWGDKFWGVCKNEGRNELGKIIMRVRKELRDGLA